VASLLQTAIPFGLYSAQIDEILFDFYAIRGARNQSSISGRKTSAMDNLGDVHTTRPTILEMARLSNGREQSIPLW
jgi:hypothetical protein